LQVPVIAAIEAAGAVRHLLGLVEAVEWLRDMEAGLRVA